MARAGCSGRSTRKAARHVERRKTKPSARREGGLTTPVIRRTATVLALLASAVFAALALADTGPPTASFEYAPAAAVSGQDITFTSTSTDPDGPLASEDWDLDNDGEYDDG